MARAANAKAVRAVSTLRALQEDAALARVETSGRAVQRVEALQTAEHARQDERYAGWVDSLETDELGLTGLWLAAIQGGQAELESLVQRHRRAREEEEVALRDWRVAVARASAARDLAQTAQRSAARAAEERRMAEAADRAAFKGRRP